MDKAIDLISGIFTPISCSMAAAGMIKGLTAMCASFGWLSKTSGTYEVLYTIGNGFSISYHLFYLLQVLRSLKLTVTLLRVLKSIFEVFRMELGN